MPDLPVQETETTIASANNKLDTISERHARRMLDRVQRGQSVNEAARTERITMAQLKDPSNPIRASIEQLVGEYFLPPEARKQMVRAGLNKVFIKNVGSDDPVAVKVALDAAKQIAADPEVGLMQDQTGGVVINIADLEGVFKQLATISAPEIKDGREDGRPREDRVLEGDFEDISGDGDKSVSIPVIPE